MGLNNHQQVKDLTPRDKILTLETKKGTFWEVSKGKKKAQKRGMEFRTKKMKPEVE